MKFAITFQQRYAYDTHPVIPEVTHKSYMIVEATDEIEARLWLSKVLRNDYSFIYVFDEDFQGQIRQFDLQEVTLR